VANRRSKLLSDWWGRDEKGPDHYVLVLDRYVVNVHPHRVRLKDVPEGDHVIFFLRDPLSRFVSGFYEGQRRGYPRYLRSWTPDEKVAFDRFRTPNQAMRSRRIERRSISSQLSMTRPWRT
jgi:hypothetical protein